MKSTGLCGLLAAMLVSSAAAQRPFIMVLGGQMVYDAGGDQGYQSWQGAAGVTLLDQRLRIGILGERANIGYEIPGNRARSTEHFTRVSTFAEFDVFRGRSHQSTPGPSIYVRGGFGVVKSSDFPRGRLAYPSLDYSGESGLSAMIGPGIRLPVAATVAVEAGMDFHYDELFGEGLRDWTLALGLAVSP